MILVRIRLFWEHINTSYWFVPALALAGSVFLALTLVALDRNRGNVPLDNFWWVFQGGAEGARTVLSTVSGSVITVAGVTFSITIAVLSLTSSQFGPRLLRGFLRDQANQFVLGTFLGTFLYCLLVLRTVRSVEENYFVPNIAVTVGLLLAIVSVCMLVFFIHNVTRSVQIDHIIGTAAEDLNAAIASEYPEWEGSETAKIPESSEGDEESIPPITREAFAVLSLATGYIQAIDNSALLTLAEEFDSRIYLKLRPGQFIIEGGTLAYVVPASSPALMAGTGNGELVQERVNGAFSIGKQRTLSQDIELMMQQVVEVAVRALSPGVNDPFTAMMCLDKLGAILSLLAARRMQKGNRTDSSGTLRLSAPVLTFAEVLDISLGPIRRYGRGDEQVMRRLMEVIFAVAGHVHTTEQRKALTEQAIQTRQVSLESLLPGEPTNRIEEAYQNILQTLAESPRLPTETQPIGDSIQH